uniref:Uncharacterized protein n=1 Tax=Anguilla anguilla TaxID=7936 RepID=A0A0E9X5K6_ANGAN
MVCVSIYIVLFSKIVYIIASPWKEAKRDGVLAYSQQHWLFSTKPGVWFLVTAVLIIRIVSQCIIKVYIVLYFDLYRN